MEPQPNVIVLTAITIEYQAATQVEAGARAGSAWRHESFEGLPIAFREFEGQGGRPLHVAVAQPGDMGAVAALAVLVPLVQKFRPRVLAMSGVCAGKPEKTALGDVVAAERLYFHDAGKQRRRKIQQDLKIYSLRDDWKIALEHFDFTERFRGEEWWEARPRPYEWQENWVLAKLLHGVVDPSQDPECATACPQWEQVIEALWRSGEVEPGTRMLTTKGQQRIGTVLIKHRNQIPDLSPGNAFMPFKVHVAPMGSGSKVIEDPGIWPFVSEHMRKTLALEMEAAALGALVQARAHLDRLDALVMKGVMDFADHGRDDHFKKYAARASAECLIAFLRERVGDVVERTGAGTPAPADAPPERSPNSRARSIFVGRTDELKAIEEALLPSEGVPRPVAIVAVQGMPGVGKSYLADRFAHEHRTRFPGGYRVLPLDTDSTTSVDMLGGRLATLVGQRAWGFPGAWDELKARLTSPPLLVHVENVDGDDAVAPVLELARRLTGCAMIVSGRSRRFGAAPEFRRVEVAPFDEFTALQLLVEELGPASTPEDLEDRRRLIRALGRLPLALHLAVGYLYDGHSIDGFLDMLFKQGLSLEPAQLDDPLLQAGRARAVISATFELSLALLRKRLGAGAAVGLAAFAVMGHAPQSGVGRSLGAAMTGLDTTAFEVLMVEAMRLSLAIGSADTRWSIHPLLAELMRGKVGGDAWVGRMTEWFVARLPAGPTQRWHEVNSEIAALERWLALVPEDDMLRVERVASSYAINSGPYQAWITFCGRLLGIHTQSSARSSVLWTLCNVALVGGALDLARQAAESKLSLDRELGKEYGVALASVILADIRAASGDIAGALHMYEEEIAPTFHRLGGVRDRAIVLGKVADIRASRGEVEVALRIYREVGLPTFERLADMRERAITLVKIADILLSRSDFDEALRMYREACRVHETLGDVRARALAVGGIADVLHALGEFDEALRIRQQEELPVFERLGDLRARARTLGRIADILQERGDLERALRIRLDEEVPTYTRLNNIRERAVALGKVADILWARGELDEALRIRQDEQIPVFERLGEVRERAIALGRIADIRAAQGNFDEAIRIRREEQIPAFERLGDVRSQAVALGKVADVLQARGDLAGALLVRRTEELPACEGLGDVRMLLIVRANIALCLLARDAPEDRYEAKQLLELALVAAEGKRIPEAEQVRAILRRWQSGP